LISFLGMAILGMAICKIIPEFILKGIYGRRSSVG